MKELFLENLVKINIFGENLLKKFSKIGVLIFQKYSKIEVVYEVKIFCPQLAKVFQNRRLFQNRGFIVYTDPEPLIGSSSVMKNENVFSQLPNRFR